MSLRVGLTVIVGSGVLSRQDGPFSGFQNMRSVLCFVAIVALVSAQRMPTLPPPPTTRPTTGTGGSGPARPTPPPTIAPTNPYSGCGSNFNPFTGVNSCGVLPACPMGVQVRHDSFGPRVRLSFVCLVSLIFFFARPFPLPLPSPRELLDSLASTLLPAAPIASRARRPTLPRARR